MNPKIKQILQNTFYQLLLVYTLLILLISLNLFWKYTLHFEIFAVILAILGISIIKKKELIIKAKPINKKLHYTLIAIAILLILFFRVIPYINNNIPLGYDAGIYKYGIEQFKEKGFQVEDWVKGAMSPGFLYLTYFLSFIFSSEFILKWIFILACLFLGLSIYFVTKECFNKKTAIISLLIYSVSIIQFKVFEFLYFKNIIALSLMLFSLYFFKKQNRSLFILFFALTGFFHLPSFYILGFSYLVFLIFNYKDIKKNLVNGIIILSLTIISYTGFIEYQILPLIMPVAQAFLNPGESPGTFISFFTYQFSTLVYLPFAILGFFALAKNKKFDMLFFLTLITAIIVYFQFFFFNRFIIHLDLALIILTSFGFSLIIENKKKLGIFVLILMLFSAGFVTLNEARNARPVITNEQVELIRELNNVEENASIIAISSEYSPYVLAYSERKTIAPGLFEENKWNKEQWEQFWQTNSKKETMQLMSVYEKPLYLFTGTKSFNNPCFAIYLEENNNKIMKYIC